MNRLSTPEQRPSRLSAVLEETRFALGRIGIGAVTAVGIFGLSPAARASYEYIVHDSVIDTAEKPAKNDTDLNALLNATTDQLAAQNNIPTWVVDMKERAEAKQEVEQELLEATGRTALRSTDIIEISLVENPISGIHIDATPKIQDNPSAIGVYHIPK